MGGLMVCQLAPISSSTSDDEVSGVVSNCGIIPVPKDDVVKDESGDCGYPRLVEAKTLMSMEQGWFGCSSCPLVPL